MKIRAENPADIDAIRSVTQRAFATNERSNGKEGAINDGLREAGTLTLSLVAEENGEIVGHTALSPVMIEGETLGWYGLGPVAVDPARHGEGIGSKLIHEALAHLRDIGAKGCVVLGDPAYYQRFGFRQQPGLILQDVPVDYFMAQVFEGDCPSGSVTYQPAFYQT